MMDIAYRKKVLILSVILGVLAVAYGLGVVFSPASVRQRESTQPLYAALKADAVQEIRIEEKGKAVSLKREGKEWSLQLDGTSYPALADRVEALLEAVAKLKRARVVSGNPQTWASFEVSKENARHLVMKDAAGKAVVDLYIGKAGAAGQGDYMRREGADEVVQTDRALRYTATLEDDFWSDLRLLPRDLQGGDLIRVDVRSRVSFDAEEKETGRGASYTLVQENTPEGIRWKALGNEGLALAADKVDGVTDNVASLEGARFVLNVPEAQSGFASPTGEVGVTTRNNKTYKVEVGGLNAAGDQYYARVEGKPYTYLVPAWRIKRILQSLESLKAEETKEQKE